MFLSNLITITSTTGAGSSSAMKKLLECLGSPWQGVSGGAIMRAMAAEHSMTIEEFSAHNREHSEEGIDLRLDTALVASGGKDYTVIESRLAHVFAPRGYHVLLTCPLDVRTRRRYQDAPATPYEVVMRRIHQRDEDDRERYLQLYPGCMWPDTDFDLIIDTSQYSVEETVEGIVSGHTDWQKRANVCSKICL